MGLTGFFKQFSPGSLLHFNTARYIKIKSFKLGLMFRFMEIGILLYVVGFAIIYQKGYQSSGRLYSTVVTKVKGSAFTNFTDIELGVDHPELYRRVWDSPDYVTPPQGGDEGGFFILTNVLITPNQSRGHCPEDPKVTESKCSADSDCEEGYAVATGNGVNTGKCVESREPGQKTCEIYAWCPVEPGDTFPFKRRHALLRQAANFTVLIKNTISFPKFGPEYLRRNILESESKTYLRTCTFSPDKDKFCPVFKINTIVQDFIDFDKVAIEGGIFIIRIKWKCNLDLDFESNCHPKYEFARMDEKRALIARGWNFRYAEYHGDNSRTLYKKFGLKFVVEVSGSAGKFNVVPLFLNIGSGLGLLGMAEIFCGFLVSFILKEDKLMEVKQKKFWKVVDNDDKSELRPNSVEFEECSPGPVEVPDEEVNGEAGKQKEQQ